MENTNNLIVTSSPHIRSPRTTRSIMLDVCIALIPAGVAAVILFGWHALALIVASVIASVASEAICQRLMHKRVTISDCAAIVAGLLVAYNVPASAPLWLPMIGSAFAIVIVKQFFGGIGKNFMNPAMAARAVMLASWMGLMAGSAFTAPLNFAVDAYSGATPLVSADTSTYSLWQLFIGNIPGSMGETCKLALLAGGALVCWCAGSYRGAYPQPCLVRRLFASLLIAVRSIPQAPLRRCISFCRADLYSRRFYGYRLFVVAGYALGVRSYTAWAADLWYSSFARSTPPIQRAVHTRYCS